MGQSYDLLGKTITFALKSAFTKAETSQYKVWWQFTKNEKDGSISGTIYISYILLHAFFFFKDHEIDLI